MRAREIAARYQQPGKQRVRQFVVDLALASKCRTALDFFGGGESARALTAAGLRVVSAESERAYWEALRDDAIESGYTPHFGRASSTDGSFDIVWADFCGHVSREMEREVRALSKKAARWLVLTINPERESDEFVVRARAASIPALLMVWSEMGLDYITRYRRNDQNQEMWLAVLSRRPGYRAKAVLHPHGVEKNLNNPHRRYWASNAFASAFPSLLPFRYRTQAKIGPRRCSWCKTEFTPRTNNKARLCPSCATPGSPAERARQADYQRRRRTHVDHPKRRCVWCNHLFKPKRVDQKACPGTNHNALYNARLFYERNGQRVAAYRRAWRERNRVIRPDRECLHCGKAFMPRSHNARYCSASPCQTESRRASARNYIQRMRDLMRKAA